MKVIAITATNTGAPRH